MPAFSEKTSQINSEVTAAKGKGASSVEAVRPDISGKDGQSGGKAIVSNANRQAKDKPSLEAGNGRRYAIQVGACNSPACVSEYRKLLMAHVSTSAIQVIERNVGNSQSLVQRIRVVSLNANDAKKLKADLAAADARFKDAYVVSLPRPPSS